MLKQADLGNVRLLPSLFGERARVNRDYLMSLSNNGLLQNFYIEAGIVMPGLQTLEDPSSADLHWGWEAPVCQLRGHFLGHWLSAASMLVKTDSDRELKAKLDVIVDELARCQQLNGGRWVGSIPEKYFKKLENGEYVWSPQYVMHKTLMGLTHAYMYVDSSAALGILENAADWYLEWTERMAKKNPHAVYSGEEGGMLEIWAALYELTKEEKFLTLSERYGSPYIFEKLENGVDPLTDCHENASIPWAHGAAKMYEITGDEKWLGLVKKFWEFAVLGREAYCTGGQGAGEYWVAKGRLGEFLGERNQEFCTVYNMVRFADMLFRFTGDKVYADYIEKNLYNGFLAQQNKFTGMPTYFLPLGSGSKKKWGGKTHDFWCCHGTMVQAQTAYPSLCYYEDADADTVVVGQYIPSEYRRGGVTVTQNTDMKYYGSGTLFDENDESGTSRWRVKFTVRSLKPERFKLSLRIPDWISGRPTVILNGEEIRPAENNGFMEIEKEWLNDELIVYFPAALTVSELPDMPDKAAFLEGPIVLAGLCENDCGIVMEKGRPETALKSVTEHTYSTFPWLQSNYISVGQPREIKFVPLYDVTDETYTVYFTRRERL